MFNDLLPSERNIGEDMAKAFEKMKEEQRVIDHKEFEVIMGDSNMTKQSKWCFSFAPRDLRIGIYFSPMGVEINLPMISIIRDVWWTSKQA
jgi:hypothetical protein